MKDWIQTKDNLPEHDMYVLVTLHITNWRGVPVVETKPSYYHKDANYFQDIEVGEHLREKIKYNVLAWMSFPSPYIPEETI
jgi:hypothetical protein